jgi:hypothetical protein
MGVIWRFQTPGSRLRVKRDRIMTKSRFLMPEQARCVWFLQTKGGWLVLKRAERKTLSLRDKTLFC